MQTAMFGLARPGDRPPPVPTLELGGDEAIQFGRHEVRAIHTPGHTPGSICLYFEESGQTPLLFAGDTLFRGSIGRTDLWGGSLPAIKHSIRDRLLTLPEATLVVPGHGAETSVAAEREDNPFVGRFAH
jgi:hydroxyacylglutathione hydrolase